MEMELTITEIHHLLMPQQKNKNLSAVKLNQQLLNKYFGSSYSAEEIELIVDKALDKYFKEEI